MSLIGRRGKVAEKNRENLSGRFAALAEEVLQPSDLDGSFGVIRTQLGHPAEADDGRFEISLLLATEAQVVPRVGRAGIEPNRLLQPQSGSQQVAILQQHEPQRMMQTWILRCQVDSLLEVVERFVEEPRIEMDGTQIAVQIRPLGGEFDRPGKAMVRVGEVKLFVPNQRQQVPALDIVGHLPNQSAEQALGLIELPLLTQPCGLTQDCCRPVHVTRPWCLRSSSALRSRRPCLSGVRAGITSDMVLNVYPDSSGLVYMWFGVDLFWSCYWPGWDTCDHLG